MKRNKTITLILILIIWMTYGVKAQVDSSYCYYKTKEDFFSNKKSCDPKTKFAHNITWEKNYSGAQIMWKVNNFCPSNDVNNFGMEVLTVAYNDRNKVIASGRTKWVNVYGPKQCFDLFLGGSANVFAIAVGGLHGTYNDEGYATEVICNEWYDIYFIDTKTDKKTKEIEEFLNAKPKLLEKYKAEKKESDRKAWKRAKLEIAMKYIKLFNETK